MNKKVVIISSSPREEGNSDLLARAFEKGALQSGNQVEFISLSKYNLGYCHGCYACMKDGKCFQDDGMNELAEKVKNANVLVLATPVYFYAPSGQLKVFLDRLVPIYTKIHADIYLFATAMDTDNTLLDKVFESIRGATRDCFENCPEKGALMVGGVTELGDINSREELTDAYNMGLDC